MKSLLKHEVDTPQCSKLEDEKVITLGEGEPILEYTLTMETD